MHAIVYRKLCNFQNKKPDVAIMNYIQTVKIFDIYAVA